MEANEGRPVVNGAEAARIEYGEVNNNIRHLYDVRMKVFGFSIALNAALMAFAFDKIDSGATQAFAGALAIVATVALWLIERRTIRVMDVYISAGLKIDRVLGTSSHSEVDQIGGVRTRKYFDALYLLMILLWLALLVTSAWMADSRAAGVSTR